MTQINNPSPFIVFCQKTIPLAFDESMSFMEALYAFKAYLENEVVPAVNTNAQAVEDLTTLVNQMQEYIDHYFDNLDVQEEINNKLDKLAQDGTLEDLIGEYIQPRIDAQNAEIAEIRGIVENVASGSPLVASSTDDMTDTTRVYVNTTDGKWYYYDGDSWEIGGTYQSSGISNSSVDVLMLDDLLQSNFNLNFSEPLDLGNAYTGFYKTDGTLNASTSFVNYHYALENGKIYTFNGENNYQCCGLVIMDSSNNVIYQSNPDISTRAPFTVTFKCKENNLTAYISYQNNYQDTEIRYYNTILRECTDVFNMLKYTYSIPEILTIASSYTKAGEVANNRIVFSHLQDHTSTVHMYQMSKGRKYKISCWDYSGVCGLLVASNTNEILYASSDATIHDSNYYPVDYTFTASKDGYILITYYNPAHPCSIEVINEVLNVDTINSPLYSKKISYNGDSIVAGYSSNGASINFPKYIGERFNMTVQNIAVGGGTVASETYNNGNPRHWINATVTNMANDNDYAVVEGGVNDASLNVTLGSISDGFDAELDTTTYYGAFENMLKQLVTRFKGKKYGYIAVHQMQRNYRITNDPSTSYYWASRKCCEKWGVPFLDLNDQIPPFAFFDEDGDAGLYGLRTSYTKDGDGWHPNEDGCKKYYVDKVISWLESL